jgi:hypothetical protein
MNLELANLQPSKLPDGKVFAYVLSTVEVDKDRFVQYGSAPNFQGGLITLCTCMRHHRTWWDSWKGVWVAGLCGKNIKNGNQLFYLMHVTYEAESHFELWYSPIMRASREAKSAQHDVFGDLFEPKSSCAKGRFDPDNYVRPVKGHRHEKDNKWHADINYIYGKRRPKLLVGDPAHSYLWEEPKCSFTGKRHPRFKVYQSLQEFLNRLQ